MITILSFCSETVRVVNTNLATNVGTDEKAVIEDVAGSIAAVVKTAGSSSVTELVVTRYYTIRL